MPPARLVRLSFLIATLLGAAAPAAADVGGTLTLQSDARDRGMSYSGNRPGAQLGLSWDGGAGWYVGAQLAWARFSGQRRGVWLQGYVGRVFGLSTALDGEAGLIAHSFQSVAHYDFREVYVGLLGERWNLRLYHSPDYYGSGQRSLYGEFNLRQPLAQGIAALAHAGVLLGSGPAPSYVEAHGPTRMDLRAGVSWQVGASSEFQLAWVAASRGGPYTWTDSTRRRSVVLTLIAAF